MNARGQGTCVLAIVSLLDVGDVPSKPDISGGGTMGVIATWRAVWVYLQLLVEACQVRRSEFGWTAYGKQTVSFPLHVGAVLQFYIFADSGSVSRRQTIVH